MQTIREIPRSTVETIRIQYASGLYSIVDLVDRWIPTVTANELEDILSYKVYLDIKPELLTIIEEMGKCQEVMIKAIENQAALAYQITDEENLGVFEDYWKDTYSEMKEEFSWLTPSIFRGIKKLPIVNL